MLLKTINRKVKLVREWVAKSPKRLWTFADTGCLKSIRTVGVASEPVEPHTLSFSGFFIYVKWNFVANLKQIGALFWKLLSFQFYTAIYIPCNLEFMKKRPEAVARSWWILQQICFISFKSYISKQFFLIKNFFSESIHDLTMTS